MTQASKAFDWTTPGQSELCQLYTQMIMVAFRLDSLGYKPRSFWEPPRPVALRCNLNVDADQMIEYCMLGGNQTRRNSPHLVPLGLLLRETRDRILDSSGCELIIRRPPRGRNAGIIQYSDELARQARRTMNCVGPPREIRDALYEGSLELENMGPRARREAR
jgi:hypothetical protein